MLRKATYREHYKSFDPAFQIEDETLVNQLGNTTFRCVPRTEVNDPSPGIDTCVEILRQALMCYPDTSMVTYYWVHGFKSPFPNNNVIHRCKNFEKILDWAAEKAVDVSSIKSFYTGETEVV